MKLGATLLAFLATSASASDDDQRSLRGPGKRGIPGKKGIGGPRGKIGEIAPSPPAEDDAMEVPSREPTGRVIVSLKSDQKLLMEGRSPKEISAARQKMKAKISGKSKVVMASGGEDDGFQVVDVGKGREKYFMAQTLAEDEDGLVDYVEEDVMEYIVAEANDPLLSNQYHHGLMKSAEAWNITTGSDQVTVGICDTGLQPNHPDLEGNRLPGFHATVGTDGCWEDDPSCTADVSNVHPHGTQCAGCAAALGNNAVGLSGVGWNFKHRPGRVSDSSGGSASSANLALCARKMCEKSDVKVVSVSYSGVEGQARRDAATYCKTQGALMVNAAGNDGRDLSQFGEADGDDLIVAGASTSLDTKSGFSAYGRFVDVWAPGSSVWTTTTGSSYKFVSGTSFSCPLVAGLIALIWSANGSLTPNEVETILKTSTDNVGIQGQWNTAYGRINSFNAVTAAGSGTPFPTPSPTTPPPTPNPTICQNFMCDDGNACTTDTCNPLGGCLNVPDVPNCCGNGQCESGEDMSTCPQDCAPRELLTTMAQNNGSGGNVFEIVAKKDIKIVGFRLHTQATSMVPVKIWHRAGNYQGFHNNAAGWTQVLDTEAQGAGTGQQTVIPLLDDPVAVASGNVHSFHVWTGQIRYTNGSNEGAVFAGNADLDFLEGKGCGSSREFQCSFSPRVFNGVILYAEDNGAPNPPTTPAPVTPSPTPNPTPAPVTPAPVTPNPTPNPTPAPVTPNPTPNPTPAPVTPAPVTPSPTPGATPGPSDQKSCPSTMSLIEIDVTTDNDPDETAWTLKNLCTGEVYYGEPFADANASSQKTLCLPPAQYEFVITDDWSDGICCEHGQGSYTITHNTDVVFTGGEFGYAEATHFGSCPSP